MTRRLTLHKGVLAAVCLGYFGVAAGAPVTPPGAGAGTILQQVNPTLAPAPLPENEHLKLPESLGRGMKPGQPIEVKKIEVKGNHRIDTVTLHGLVADGEGKTLTLVELARCRGLERIGVCGGAHGSGADPGARGPGRHVLVPGGKSVLRISRAGRGRRRASRATHLFSPP